MIAAVFPGQGSQKPGMGQSLVESFPVAERVFEAVSQATGVDTRHLCFELDEETLRQTQNAQLALFTCGVAAHAVAVEHGLPFDAFAGHSVGEYAALTAAGVLSISDGARLVQKRGQVMAEAGSVAPGTMAAVLGLERGAIQAVLDGVDGVVVIANDNCPGQLVISGEVEAVTLASTKLTEAGAKRVLPLNVSGAFHSPLMAQPAEAMREALSQADFLAGGKVVANVTASVVEDPGQWARLLVDQLKSPVRWTESVLALKALGVNTLVEFGVGEVLGGLAKRIDREIASVAIFDAESLVSTREKLSIA